MLFDVVDQSAKEGDLRDVTFNQVRSPCLLHVTRVFTKLLP